MRITTISTTLAKTTSPHWDSNPDWIDFKSTASAGWAMGGHTDSARLSDVSVTDPPKKVGSTVGQNGGAYSWCER